LKEYTGISCFQGPGFLLFTEQIRLFQRCLLKKAKNTSNGKVLVDECGGWAFFLLLSTILLTKHVLGIVSLKARRKNGKGQEIVSKHLAGFQGGLVC
jgi:hypothetical protein